MKLFPPFLRNIINKTPNGYILIKVNILVFMLLPSRDNPHRSRKKIPKVLFSSNRAIYPSYPSNDRWDETASRTSEIHNSGQLPLDNNA